MYNLKIIAVAVLLIAVGAGVLFILNRDSDPEPKQQEQLVPPPAPVPAKTLERKAFSFRSTGQNVVAGTGTLNLQNNVTSVGARLQEASNLAPGEQYELYVVLPGRTQPVLVGKFNAVDSTTEAYVLGTAGAVVWYDAEKVLITKRRTTQAEPGQILTEAVPVAAK